MTFQIVYYIPCCVRVYSDKPRPEVANVGKLKSVHYIVYTVYCTV